MDDPPKSPIPLQYSSVAEEQNREKQAEAARRAALENYNESTFGQRHPFAIWPTLLVMAIGCVMVFVLPRWAARPAVMAIAFAYFVWDRFRSQ
jgi:hypothetical protein